MKNKVIFLLIIVLVTTLVFPMTVSAASGITEIDEFESITGGDGQYIKYADNYHLDIKKVGIMDKDKEMINNVANFFFGVFKNFSYLSIVVFYHCFSFDITEMFGTELNGIQLALRNLLFGGEIFLIVFATVAFYIVNQLLKGDIQGILNEVLKVVAILIISLAVTTQSDTFLSFVNTTTKQISVEALGSISGQSLSSTGTSVKSYAADASGMLWSGLVHKPWLSLEFGDDNSGDSYAEDILSLSINSDDRKELIEDLNESKGFFAEDVGTGRLTSAFFMALPIILKCVFYLLIALLQMLFQLFTLFYIILCPVILILAISPQLGGTELIWFWLKKVIETQLSILILTFVIGLVVKFDAILANWNNVGWLIGLYLQVFVMAALVLNWQRVLGIIKGATRSIQNPRLALAMRQMQRGGGMAVNTINGVAYGAQQLGSLTGAAGLGAAGVASGAGAALMGVASGAWDGLAENYTAKANYNNVQQYQPRPATEDPSTPPSPGVPAPTNISEAAGSETVNVNAVAHKNNVIDYSKIPKYESSRMPIEQAASLRKVANGEVLNAISGAVPQFTRNTPTNHSGGFEAAQSVSNSTQRLYSDNRYAESPEYTTARPTSRGDRGSSDTVNYNISTPSFKPENKSTPEVAQTSAPLHSDNRAAGNASRAGTKAGDTQRPVPISYNATAASYISRAEMNTEAAQRPATVNYNATAGNYTPKMATSPEAAQRPQTAAKPQGVDKKDAKAQTASKSQKKAANERPASIPPQASNQSVSRNSSVINNTRQFTPKPVVDEFTFKTREAPQKSIQTESLNRPRPKREPVAKPKPVVEQFNFKTYKTDK